MAIDILNLVLNPLTNKTKSYSIDRKSKHTEGNKRKKVRQKVKKTFGKNKRRNNKKK